MGKEERSKRTVKIKFLTNFTAAPAGQGKTEMHCPFSLCVKEETVIGISELKHLLYLPVTEGDHE